jgi:RHH-type transcriptional regulator, proline utilization regulon repressor / proline dehydrogenase / delta 1-pyrroline-5-carboxylate dehydrogenase
MEQPYHLTDAMLAKLMHISHQAFTPEQKVVQALLPYTKVYQDKWEAITRRATGFVEDIRAAEISTGVESFVQHYGLEKKEGIAIMCLAEALLRVPDNRTADALIEDKFRDTHWQDYLKNDSSLLIRASTFGLILTGIASLTVLVNLSCELA